jgi:glucose/mannose-6-phosphate isomerase
MTLEEIKRVDQSGMYDRLLDFHAQVEDAVRIGKRASLKLGVKGVANIVLTGMGGSAIGGDLLLSYLTDELRIPFVVNRHYALPGFVDRRSLVIVSSYSGNTEETIAAHRDAIRRKARVLCITTGGETERLAVRYRQPIIKIPTGFQPRAALGYSFFPLLQALSRLGFAKQRAKDIGETIKLLRAKARVYGQPDAPDNAPLQLARQLKGTLPIIYSAAEYFDAIGLRWREQICENAKKLAFGHVIPEMNHNELVGWKIGAETMRQMEVVFLRDRKTHGRIAKREEITKEILSRYALHVLEFWSEGRSLLARMFSLIYFGDWVSFYLAVLNNEDPTPVMVIEQLKGELARI